MRRNAGRLESPTWQEVAQIREILDAHEHSPMTVELAREPLQKPCKHLGLATWPTNRPAVNSETARENRLDTELLKHCDRHGCQKSIALLGANQELAGLVGKQLVNPHPVKGMERARCRTLLEQGGIGLPIDGAIGDHGVVHASRHFATGLRPSTCWRPPRIPGRKASSCLL